MMKPKSEALAFRIWQYATPLGWNCDIAEVAEALGVSISRAASICKMKGWISRFRAQRSQIEIVKHRNAQLHLTKEVLDQTSEILGMMDAPKEIDFD